MPDKKNLTRYTDLKYLMLKSITRVISNNNNVNNNNNNNSSSSVDTLFFCFQPDVPGSLSRDAVEKFSKDFSFEKVNGICFENKRNTIFIGNNNDNNGNPGKSRDLQRFE